MSQDRPFPHHRIRETGTMLFLSLFLLLLAFFILLNALSTLEEVRSRAVLSSVASTFKTDVLPDTTAEILISTLGPVPQPEDVTEELERLWVTAVPVAKIETLKPGRTLQMTMRKTDIFVGGEAAVRADRNDLMRATAYALAARLEGFTVQARITLGIDRLDDVRIRDNPAFQAAAEQDVSVVNPDDPEAVVVARQQIDPEYITFQRSTLLARALVEGGAPPGGLATGLKEGLGDRVRVRFDILPIDQSQVTFGETPEETPDDPSVDVIR
ncbi:MAG: hypothetical protein RIM72_19330 [Alphaproteobacteria bacterium]